MFWVAPVYSQVKRGWKYFTGDCPQQLITSINRSDLLISLINGSTIQCKSAEIPDHLRSEDVDLVVCDEAAFMNEEAWYAIQTTLTRTRGRGVFISTPKGKNWFYDLYKRGLEDKTGVYKSFLFPTSLNPYIDGKEIEDAKGRLPKKQFEMDYLAVFADDYGSVFDGDAIRTSIDDSIVLEPVADDVYVIGVDIGRHEDATVLTALNQKSQVKGHKYIPPNTADWNDIPIMIKDFAKHYNDGLVVIDSTGVGDPIYETLLNDDVPIVPFDISGNREKKALIHKLAIALEQGRLHYPNIEVLIEEMKDFGYRVSETTGAVRYGAPHNKHDDTVLSLALAVWYGSEEGELCIGKIRSGY